MLQGPENHRSKRAAEVDTGIGNIPQPHVHDDFKGHCECGDITHDGTPRLGYIPVVVVAKKIFKPLVKKIRPVGKQCKSRVKQVFAQELIGGSGVIA